MNIKTNTFIFPRILHLYWNGPLPFLNFLTVVSFKKYHPNWKINIYITTKINNTTKWTTGEQKHKIICYDYMNELSQLSTMTNYDDFKKNYSIINTSTLNIIDTSDLCEKLKIDNLNYTYQSDILRMYFLKEFGGLWSDFDIIYIKNIENIFNKYKTDICFRIKHVECNDYYYPIGFLLSTGKNSIIYNKIFNEQVKILQNTNVGYQKFGVVTLKNIFLTNNSHNVKKLENIYKVIFLGQEYYLPYVWTDLHLLFDSIDTTKIKFNTVGIHWFNGASKVRIYVNMIEKINSNNFKVHCTMDQLILPYLKYKKFYKS